jgi:ribonucleotide monophosphatase NagD (HAD superfamily)
MCVNPDKLMLTAAGNAPGAGRIAEIYQELGGDVTWTGMPFSEIYHSAAKLSGVEDRRAILYVGDSLEHDIVGAHMFGAFAALVRTGLLTGVSDKELSAEIGRHGSPRLRDRKSSLLAVGRRRLPQWFPDFRCFGHRRSSVGDI